MNTIKTNQSVAQEMVQAFAANSTTVAEGTFFGTPIRAYFGEPQVNNNPVEVQQPWQASYETAVQIITEISEMGVLQENPTFFGVPIAEYFNRSDENIWQTILEDVSLLKPAPVAS